MQSFQLPDVRRLPMQTEHRLSLAQYRAFPATNPNGQARPARIIGEGALRLGRDYCFLARVCQCSDGIRTLEVEATTYDTLTCRSVDFQPEAPLIRAVYDTLVSAHVAAKAKQHARGAGRN